MLRFTCIVLALVLCGIASGQKAVSSEIQNLKIAGIDFHKIDFLKFQSADIQNREFNLQSLKKGTIIRLDQSIIDELYQDGPDFITIPVPITSRTNMVLTLKRHDIFAPDFKLFTSSDPTQAIDYTPVFITWVLLKETHHPLLAFLFFGIRSWP